MKCCEKAHTKGFNWQNCQNFTAQRLWKLHPITEVTEWTLRNNLCFLCQEGSRFKLSNKKTHWISWTDQVCKDLQRIHRGKSLRNFFSPGLLANLRVRYVPRNIDQLTSQLWIGKQQNLLFAMNFYKFISNAYFFTNYIICPLIE